MRVYKFSNNQTLTSNLAELQGKTEYAKVQKGKWFHFQRIYVIKSSNGEYGLISLNFFERLAKNICKCNSFKGFEGKKMTLLSKKNLPQQAQNTSNVSKPIINQNWNLDDREQILLNAVKNNPRVRAGSYISEEFFLAFQCMKEGKPENFKSLPHLGQGTHIKQHTNAHEFLADCVRDDSVFRNIIASYRELQEKNEDFVTRKNDSPLAPKSFKELADGLELLLNRVRIQLQ